MESAFKGYILAGRGQVENTSAELKSFTAFRQRFVPGLYTNHQSLPGECL